MRRPVRKSVVVYVFFVLVGANYFVDVVLLFLFVPFQTTGPEYARVEQDFVAVFFHKVLVAGELVILPNPKRNVGSDVLFNKARPDFGRFSRYDVGGSPHGRYLAVVGPGRLPRVHGSFVAVFGGFFVRAWQGFMAIFHEAAPNFGKRE